MRVLKPILFLLVVLLAVELTFRVYLYGPAALNPWKMDSFNQIHHSGLLRSAADPDIYFELLPDLDTLYKGTAFTTNAEGQRDRTYTVAKPDDTFRVVVLGSSWTMGSGVSIDKVWHSRLEEMLNSGGTRTYEFINFGVDQYGLREILETLEKKALPYEPDLILVALTYYTPAVLWPDTSEPYKVLQRRHPFFESHALRVIDHRFGLGWFAPDDSVRPKVEGTENFNRQLRRASDRLIDINTATGIPIAIAKLAYMRSWRQNKEKENLNLTSNAAYTYLDVTDAVANAGFKPRELSVSVWDSHPNERAHQLIAEAVLSALRDQGLLP